MSDPFLIPEYPQFNFERYLAEKSIDTKIHESNGHDEVAINCPECHNRGEPTPDRKQKLWINCERGTFCCYRCGFAGGIINLVQALSQCSFTAAIMLVRGRNLNPLEHFELNLFDPDLKIKMHDVEAELKEIELPYGFKPITGPNDYLEERGIPWQYAARNNWGTSIAGYTKGRLIVPFFMDEKLVYWQARLMRQPKGDEQKVLNPKGISARNVLFNFDIAKKYEKIVLVEGFVDCVKTGPNAMATNGKNLHPQQLLLLEQTAAKEVVLMWDNDAWVAKKGKESSAQKAISLLKMANFKVLAVKLPEDRDPGSFRFRSKKLAQLIEQAKLQ